MSAFDLATSYPDLGKKLFPDGACHPSISEISEDILGAAWALFESLEKRIAAATSLAAKSVNRNQVGYKRYNFRPLRYDDTIGFMTRQFGAKYTHTFFRGLHSTYVKTLAMFLQFLKVCTWFANCALRRL